MDLFYKKLRTQNGRATLDARVLKNFAKLL